MATRKWITIAILWVLSLIIVATIAHGQAVTVTPSTTVLSGSDLGFRVVRREGDHVVGDLVVRVNGDWVHAEPAGGPKLRP